jgi:ABC-type nitrate/sulfonate/bicarbonate transport system permease component
MDTRHVFVGVVTFGLLGVATTWLLKELERVTGPWIQRSN